MAEHSNALHLTMQENKSLSISCDFIFHESPVAMAVINQEGFLLNCNSKFEKLLEIHFSPAFNYLINSHRSLLNHQKPFLNKLENGFVHEEVWNHGPRKYCYIKETFKGFRSAVGDLNYLVTVEDITELRKINRSYLISEEKHNVFFDQIPVGIYRFASTGELLFANKRLAEILGYSGSNDIIGKTIYTLCHIPEENVLFVKHICNHHQTFYTAEFKTYRQDNKPVWVRDTANVTYDSSSNVLYIDGIIEDITGRKKTESELDQLITAINQISEVIVVTDLEGRIIYTNPAFEKLTLYSLSEVSGKNMNILKSGVQGKNVYAKLWKTILDGKNWSGNLINKKKNGDLYEEHCVITPVRNIRGDIVSFVSIKRDITEEKKLESHLRHSQKLQAIGTLAGGIAHDFNNILMGMQVFTEILLKKIPQETQEHHLLERIYTSQDRAKSLIKQILSFSRLSGDEKESLQIHVVVKEALKLLKATFPATIKLEQKVEDCGFITANPAQIQQIVMNICTNAHHAMEGEGTLTIELKKVDSIDLPESKKCMSEHQWVLLIVKDTGCGIEDKIKERIFEPFFTTKSVGSGTGLGLSTVHGIVKQYGGEIYFTTKIGTGTNFYIYLPAL